MHELLQHANPGVLIIFTVCSAWVLVSVTSIIARQWGKARQAEIDAALKHKMVEQGMCADDIIRVLQTSTTGQTEASAGRKCRR